jgi:transglutaminase-like putative cysteine protease
MHVRVGCQFRFTCPQPTPTVWQLRPRQDGAHRLVLTSWATDPEMPLASYYDAYGNTCDRLSLPPGASRIRYDAVVDVAPTVDDVDLDATWIPVDELPPKALVYLLPSRFCEADLLREQAWELFGAAPRGYRQVQQVCDWVHHHVSFDYATTSPVTTAVQVLGAGQGVCRDFAHLGVALCRALSIPARYTCGYLPDIGVEPNDAPMDFCAWFEAYLGGRWWTLDPRNNVPRAGRVVIGRGRDAVDVAMVTAYGGVELNEMTVWADEVGAGAHD